MSMHERGHPPAPAESCPARVGDQQRRPVLQGCADECFLDLNVVADIDLLGQGDQRVTRPEL